MLDEVDAAQLKRIVNLLRWRRHPAAAPAEHIEKQYHDVMEKTSNPAVRDFVDWRIGGRAAMAALRLKALGQATPPAKHWGAGRLVKMIETNWAKSEVGASALFPWLAEARQLLANDDAISLERIQMAAVWRRLSILGEINPFGFEYVAAYVFKWDILQRWISYEPHEARQRFRKLITEVIDEHQLSCN